MQTTAAPFPVPPVWTVKFEVVLAKAGDDRFVRGVRNRISRIIDSPD